MNFDRKLRFPCLPINAAPCLLWICSKKAEAAFYTLYIIKKETLVSRHIFWYN